MEDGEYVRLHITPFTPALLNTYLPSSILPTARDISYHQIQTFPERAYGYVSLPTMNAEKIKKKLNNTILKGTKVRIETARLEPEKPVPETAETKKEHKKRKRERDEIPAADIGERHVKRGWTVPAAQSRAKGVEKTERVEKSKFTNAPECLFKTAIPPNVASKGSAPVKESKEERKGKKQVLVHEFSKSTKYATFLRTSGGNAKKKPAAEFVEGKGWVDEDGNVVEEVKSRTRNIAKSKSDTPQAAESSSDHDEASQANEPIQGEQTANTTKSAIPGDVDEEDSEDSPSSDSSSSDEEAAHPVTSKKNTDEPVEDDSSSDSPSEEEEETTPKGSPSLQPNTLDSKPVLQTAQTTSNTSTSSSDTSDSDSSSDSDSDVSTPTKPSTSRPQSSSGPPTNLSITIPPLPSAMKPVATSTSTSTTTTNTAIHPLEALYKRPAPPTNNPTSSSSPTQKTAAAPSFSFFGADTEDVDVDVDMDASDEPQVPLTPYTQRDFEWRGMRSAAPTPDTAHANKRFIWPVDGEGDDDDEGTAPTPVVKDKKLKGKEVSTKDQVEEEKGGNGRAEESEFQKWFYEHRGEANRAWKKRRKVVSKEKRQRENRKRDNRV